MTHSYRFQINCLILLGPTLLISWCPLARAQVIPDTSLGSEQSVVTPDLAASIPTEIITGGALRGQTLFHSFEQFSIQPGATVQFNNSSAVETIISRVTGSSPSTIDGWLQTQGRADLFILNPNGIVFGSAAQLDLGGSLVASTAQGLQFAEGVVYDTERLQPPPLLAIDVPVGLQMGASGAIEVLGALELQPENTLALVGGDLTLNGGLLVTPSGRIELGSVADAEEVTLTSTDRGFELSYDRVQAFQDINLTDAVLEVVGAGGEIQVQGRQIGMDRTILDTRPQDHEAAGDVVIQSSESIDIRNNSQLLLNVPQAVTGNGGTLTLRTGQLFIQEGSLISARAFGAGEAGDIDIRASDSVEIIESDIANSGELGAGGQIAITTNHLRLQDGAQVFVGTSNQESSGNMTIRADQLEIIGQIVVANEVIPSGLFSTVSPGATGDGGNIQISANRLRIQDGQIGVNSAGAGQPGNIEISSSESIEINNGILFTAGDLGSQAGTINLETPFLSLQDGSEISIATFAEGDAGDLLINADQIELLGVFTSEAGETFQSGMRNVTLGSGTGGDIVVEADTLQVLGGQISTGTGADGEAGDVMIRADTIEVQSDQTLGIVSADSVSSGAGGDILIEAQQLKVQGALVSTSAFAEGDAGNLNIMADRIEVLSEGRPGSVGNLLTDSVSSGAAGNIVIETQQLLIQGGNISTDAFDQGNAGNIAIQADSIELRRLGETGAGITTGTASTGAGGNLLIETQQLTNQGGVIATRSTGEGNAGDMEIRATGTIEISSEDNFVGGLLTESSATGAGGQLTIATQNLTILDGSQVSASTGGAGNAGDLWIHANGAIFVSGISANGQLASAIAASSGSDATGDGGDLTLTTQSLLVQDGAQISTTTFGEGNAGNLTVNASRSLAVEGQIVNENQSTPSGIFTLSGVNASGAAGDLFLTTGTLQVAEGATIQVSSLGETSGATVGDLTIQAESIQLNTQGSLEATSQAGNQGNIAITTSDLQLNGNSLITTNAFGSATGGNIVLEIGGLVAIENSDITANAEQGNAGNITITAEGLFIDGEIFDQNNPSPVDAEGNIIGTPDSDIVANSQFGAQGQIDLTEPNIDPATGLIELPTQVTRLADLIVNTCTPDQQQSTFLILGRGGISQRPGNLSTPGTVWHDLRVLPQSSVSETNSANLGQVAVLIACSDLSLR